MNTIINCGLLIIMIGFIMNATGQNIRYFSQNWIYVANVSLVNVTGCILIIRLT